MPTSDMRSRILAAARAILEAEGVEAMSMRRIAGRLGCSVGTLYNHVADKDEVLGALIGETHATVLRALAAARDVPDRERRLRRGIHDYVELAAGLGDLYRVMMTSRSPQVLDRTRVLHRGAAAERPAVAMLRDEIASAARDGDDAEALAQAVWSAIFGLALRSVVEGVDAEQRARLAGAVADLALRLIGPTERRPR